MKPDVLKNLLRELVKASPEYMKKETVRGAIQDVIVDLVNKGDIDDDESLEDFFSSVDIAVRALKMVPFKVYKKLAS